MRTIETRPAVRTGRRIGWTTLLFTVFFATPALAQRGPGPPDPADRIERLREALDLNAEQATELEAIFAEQRDRMRELRQSDRGDREARQEAFRELREETHERIGQVLTEEQVERFRELGRERMHDRRKGDRPQGRRGGS